MPTPPSAVLSVSELTRRIKATLTERFSEVWVEGEISNLRVPQSGHVYFTLKDGGAQLAAVLFRGTAATVKFKLRDGLAVIAFGDISVYERQGQYQLVIRQLLPKGLGALQLAFEELKQRLAKEGLFDPARKKPLPVLPQRIGLVTSPSGAAVRDFLNIIGRRYPNVHIIINPVRVQGEGAAAEIAAAVDEFNALDLVDVIIVTRGGGSLEDLWPFNEEIVARALARSRLPTISAVGHEIDFTISDFVADLRAPTPSAAAELVVAAKDQFTARLADYQRRLDKDLRLRLATIRERFQRLATSYVFRQPAEVIHQYAQRLDDLRYRLHLAAPARVAARRRQADLLAEKVRLLSPQLHVRRSRQRLDATAQRLRAAMTRRWHAIGHRWQTVAAKLALLSPQATLARGYSITRHSDGRIVRSVAEVQRGDRLSTMVADGEFGSVVS